MNYYEEDGRENYIEISTVVGCKNNCDYCPQKLHVKSYKEREQPQTEMTYWTFKECLKHIPKEFIITFGGMSEPFQNPNTPRMIAYAYSQGYKVALYTTLYGYKPSYDEVLQDVEYYSIRLHLPDDKNIMKVKMNNEYVRNTIHFVRSMKCKNFVITDMVNDDHLMRSRAGNVSLLKDREVLKTYTKMSCRGKRYPGSQVVLPNGDVTICCNDYGLKHIMGNLVTEDFSIIWQRIKESGMPNSNEMCKYCDFGGPLHE